MRESKAGRKEMRLISKERKERERQTEITRGDELREERQLTRRVEGKSKEKERETNEKRNITNPRKRN